MTLSKQASRGAITHYNFYSMVIDPMTTCGCCEGNRCHIAGLQRRDDGEPRIRRGDPLRHEVHHPGRRHGWRGIFSRVLWDTPSTTSPSGNSSGGRWAAAHGLDAQDAQGRDSRSGSRSGARRWGFPNLYDMIADETVGTTEEEIWPFLEGKRTSGPYHGLPSWDDRRTITHSALPAFRMPPRDRIRRNHGINRNSDFQTPAQDQL